MEIDLNADLGEGYGDWRMGDDDALLDVLSSANLACGFHAGDPTIMQHAIGRAMARGVDIGAHVGFPDRQGFGRRVIAYDDSERAAMVLYQLGALTGLARAAGARVSHMSFHGAMGNLAAANKAYAAPMLRAVAAFDPSLIVLSSTSPAIESAAAEAGLRVVTSFLADRAYTADGMLVSRRLPGAVIHDTAAVLDRVRRLLHDGTVLTHDGSLLHIPARSILLHGDTPGSLALARAIRDAISEAGGRVVPLSQQSANAHDA